MLSAGSEASRPMLLRKVTASETKKLKYLNTPSNPRLPVNESMSHVLGALDIRIIIPAVKSNSVLPTIRSRKRSSHCA